MNKLLYIIPLLFCISLGVATAAIVCTSPYTFNDTDVPKNVSEGKVCINATDYNVTPTISVYCALYRDCIIDQCETESLFAGYKGDGTSACSTNTSLLSAAVGIATGPTIPVPYGYRITATEKNIANASVGDGCTVGTAAATVLHYCGAQPYTIYGNVSFCNGDPSPSAGPLADAAVTAGTICYAGVSTTVNSTLNCGTWNECILGATSYSTYYVGYSGSSCTDTSWVATGTTIDILNGLAVTTASNSADSCILGNDNNGLITGISNTRNLAFAGFGLLAVIIIAMVAFAVVQIFNGGNVDLMTIAMVAISGGIILFVAYVIIYLVSKGLGVG